MVFGTIQFICSKCRNKFESLMAEYQCTSFIAPMPCPKCKSVRTMPNNIKSKFIYKGLYSKIWEEMEKNKKK